MKFIFLVGVFALLFFFPANASAQKAQRIKLFKSQGESGAALEGAARGTIAGAAHLDFVFKARRHQGMDLNMDTKSGDDVSFEIIAPNGKILVKDTTDFLDEAPTAGDYTVRIYIVGGKAGSRKKSSFRFSVFMYV